MARKWLSGVLAFTMVFGCTAPMALAEEAPVENVEEMGDVEQYALYNPHFAKSEYEITNAEKATVTLELQQVPTNLKDAPKVTIKDDDAAKAVEYEWNSNFTKLTVKLKSKFGTPRPIDVTVKYAEPVADAEGNKDTYVTYEAKTKINMVAEADTQIKVEDEGTAGFNVEVGKTEAITFSVAGKKPYKVSVKPMTDAADYVSFKVEDAVEDGEVIGTKVVATGLKKVPADKKLNVKITVQATEATEPDEQPYAITVVDATTIDAVTALSVKADKTKIENKNDSATIIAQAMKADEYGDNESYDNAELEWAVNGMKLEFEGNKAELKDVLGKAYLTVEKTSGVDGIIKVSGTKVGDYTFVATPKTNSYLTAAATISIVESEKASDLSLADTTFTTAAAGKIDLNAQSWKVNTDKTLADFGATVKYTLAEKTQPDSYTPTESQVKEIATIADGVLTIDPADDELLAALFEDAAKQGKTDIVFAVKAQGYVGDTKFGNEVELTITVAKSQIQADSIEIFVDGVSVYNSKTGLDLRMPVLTVGKDVDVDVVVKDKYGFSDSVDQRVIFSIDNKVDPFDKNVYAEIDDVTGVITPKMASSAKAYVSIVPVAGTGLAAKAPLYIVADPTATPEPSDKPTEEPTEKPTEKPEVQLGKVATSSSSLNVRETPDGEKIGSLKKGAIVTILGKEGDWLLVTDGDLTGYVAARYIDIIEDKPEQPETGVATVKTKGGALNMRKTASSKGTVITKIANGTTVTVVEKGDDWTKIKYNGKTGYVSTQYLEFEEDAVG